MFSLKSRIFASLFIIISVFTIIIGYLSGVVMPILYSKSEAYMKIYIERSVAAAIVESGSSGLFLNPVKFQYNSDGSISAYTTDTLSMATLRAFISNSIIDSIENEVAVDFKINVGTLSGIPFLYGKGPEMDISLTEMNFVTCETASEFTDSGINQTLHRVLLKIEAVSIIKEPLTSRQISTDTTIPLSETVIVGDVPAAYTVIHRAYEDDEEDINDYGAHLD